MNDEVTEWVCGVQVIMGNIISPECKTLANCILDLNVRDLNNFITEHRSPQKVTSHPTTRTIRGGPRFPE